MEEEWKKKHQKKLDEEGLDACGEFIDDLPIAENEKDELYAKCVVNWESLSLEDKLAVWDSCNLTSDDPDVVRKRIGAKILIPAVQSQVDKVNELTNKILECEIEAEKAPDAKTNAEFKKWCYSGISKRSRNPDDEIGEFKFANSSSSLKVSPSFPEGGAFQTSRKVVREMDVAENEVSHEAISPSAAHKIAIIRKFGVRPLDKAKIVTPTIFNRFEKIVNRMIRAGASLPDHLFRGKTLIATKLFYDAARRTPSIESLWRQRETDSFKLHNRTWRCAAQYAYFSLRDHKLRVRLLHYFIDVLQSLPDSTLLFDSKFPQKEVLDAIYLKLHQTDIKLTKGQLSFVYLTNVLRWIRNLIKRGFRSKYGQSAENLFNALPVPPHSTFEMTQWITRNMTNFLKLYLRSLSRRMTSVVNRVLKSPQRVIPASRIGALVRTILKEQGLSIRALDAKKWNRMRTHWRNRTLKRLEGDFNGIDIITLVTHAIKEARADLTPERIVKLIFNFRPSRMRIGEGDSAEFKAFLVKRVITEIEYRHIILLKPLFIPTLHMILADLQSESRGWIKLPRFQKQSIPFSLDDERIYIDKELKDLYILALNGQGVPISEIISVLIRNKLEKWKQDPENIVKTQRYIEKLIEYNVKNHWFEKVKKGKEPIRVQIRLEKRKPIWLKLGTPKRFLKLVQAGYIPQKATLLKKSRGRLVLALPFEKVLPQSQYLGRSDLNQMQHPLIIAGLDPGLKTMAVLSVGEGDENVLGAWGQAGREIARYFFDQKQFGEKRTEWFKPLKSKVDPPDYKKGKFPNLKRRLTNLRRELRRRQSERDEYRNACRKKGINYRHKQKFFKLNRTVKQIWDNVSALHDELTRQIATCILAACEHHHVNVIRMEDLRWSKHSKKYEISYFLTSNQIHWFFGQIQARIANLAPRKGIFVEWVKAKYTSSRCSECGYIGKTKAERKKARQGKTFKCPQCGREKNGKWVPFQLDADLNAARNIRIAPRSNIPPSLYALAGGSPYNPLADESLSA